MIRAVDIVACIFLSGCAANETREGALKDEDRLVPLTSGLKSIVRDLPNFNDADLHSSGLVPCQIVVSINLNYAQGTTGGTQVDLDKLSITIGARETSVESGNSIQLTLNNPDSKCAE